MIVLILVFCCLLGKQSHACERHKQWTAMRDRETVLAFAYPEKLPEVFPDYFEITGLIILFIATIEDQRAIYIFFE